MNISDTEFSDSRSVGNGGAIAALGTDLHVQTTRFHGCSSSGSGGAVHAVTASSQNFDPATGSLQEEIFRSRVSMQECHFVNCSCALQGAGASLAGSDAFIASSQFVGCVSKGSGGGIAFSDSKSSLRNNTFQLNVAADGGGGLFFASSVTSLEQVPDFGGSSEVDLCGKDGNFAGYGNCRASSPWTLQVGRSEAEDSKDRQKSVGQPEIEMRFFAQMLDFYGNHLVADSSSQILVLIRTPLDQNLTVLAKTETMNGGRVELAAKAFYNFKNLTSADWEMATSELYPFGAVFKAPARSQKIDFVAILSGGQTITTQHEVSMPGGSEVCPLGHVFYISDARKGGCKACPEGKYSINPVFAPKGARGKIQSTDIAVFENLCLPCPAGATCRGGASFEPNNEQSIWVSDEHAWKLLACPRGHRKMVCPPGLEDASKPCMWDHDWQRCEPCAAGKFILNSSDHTSVCRDCPTSAKCQVP